MPFRIIRNDITRVRADAIVNTANPEPRFGAGTDSAVYRAAGAGELLAERKKIGRIAPGEAAVTAAYRLPAKYIIHTVGPAWKDGKHGEFDILRSCYRKSLLLADHLGCESIAFPLIATGVYGFPRDRALETALSVIRDYLEDSDLDVILVVFGESSYQIAAGLTERIEEYIDENYVSARTEEEYGSPEERIKESGRRRKFLEREWPWFSGSRDQNRKPSVSAALPPAASPEEAGYKEDLYEDDLYKDDLYKDDLYKEDLHEDALYEEDLYEDAAEAETVFSAKTDAPAVHSFRPKKASLEDIVNNLGESFQTRLFRMIDERGMTDPEVYKRANLDRKLFSKIRCSEDYLPKKKTIIALAIALRLNLDDTRDLLASAGLLLTNNSRSDVIVSFCIENGIYDIYEVNSLLFKFHQPILG